MRRGKSSRHLAWIDRSSPIMSDNIVLCDSSVVDKQLVLARNDRSDAALFQDSHPDHRPHKNGGSDH